MDASQIRPKARAKTSLLVALTITTLIATAAASSAQTPAASSGSSFCPTFPCWVINTAGIYNVERHSRQGSGRTRKRFANASTYPVLQADKVAPGDPDWAYYTKPPSHIRKGGAERTEQFWNFQKLWLSCPPPGSPGAPEHYVPPPDVNAFFMDLETGVGSLEDVDTGDPLIVAYQAWVRSHLGVAIGPDTAIERQYPRLFLAAAGPYIHALALRPRSDPCYRPAPVAIQVPSTNLGGTDLGRDPNHTDRQNFLDLNIAGAAANGTDILGIQWQWDELNIPLYQQDNAATAAQARAVEPNIVILADLSTLPARCDPSRPSTCVSADQLRTAYEKVQEVTKIDGFYLGAYADDSAACHSTDLAFDGEVYPLCHSDIEVQAVAKFLASL